jgi:hypothetical protein
VSRRLRERWRSLRFLQLFALTVLLLLLTPLQLRFRALGPLLALLYLNAVAVSLSAAGYRRLRWPFLAGCMLVLVLKLVPVADSALERQLYVTSRLLVVVLLSGSVAAVLVYVLRGAAVSMDRIFAAIVAYLLAGLGFAAAYQAIATVAPESFALPPAAGGADAQDWLEVQLMYFSFITIATVGYGDIAPRLPLAQMLAVLEAVVGQFYVAVVIAWLVSVYAGARRPEA